MEKGWHEGRAFCPTDTNVLDASLLYMPLVVSPYIVWQSAARDGESSCRTWWYDPAASPDGLRGEAPSPSAFWYVDGWRLRPAGKMLDVRQDAHGNHLGLYSERLVLQANN
jgi:hypothetical protein